MKTLFQITVKAAFRDIYLLLWSLLMPAAGILLLGNLIGEISYKQKITIGMMVAAVAFYAFNVTAYLIMAQRKRGVYHLLKVTSMKTWEYVSSVSAAWITIATICGLVVFFVGVIAFDIALSLWAVLMLLPILCIGAGAYVCLSFFIAVRAKDEAHLSMLTNLLILPLLFCSDAFYTLDKAPYFVKAIQAVNPVQWFINAVSAALSMELQVYFLSLLLLGIFLLAMFFGALKSFRTM